MLSSIQEEGAHPTSITNNTSPHGESMTDPNITIATTPNASPNRRTSVSQSSKLTRLHERKGSTSSSLSISHTPQGRRSPSIISSSAVVMHDKKSFWTILDVLSTCFLTSSGDRIDFYPQGKEKEMVQTEVALMLYEHYLQDLLHFEDETDPSSPTVLTSLASPSFPTISIQPTGDHPSPKLNEKKELIDENRQETEDSLHNQGDSPAVNTKEVIDYTGTLFDCLQFLDTRMKLLPWILDLPLEPGDDVNDCLSGALSERPLSDDEPRLLFFKVMAYICFALGDLLVQAGNVKQGYHMIRCAILILDRTLRFPQTPVLYGQDLILYQHMYEKATEIAIDVMEAYDDAVEFASKLIASYEATAAEWVKRSTDILSTSGNRILNDAEGCFRPPNPYQHYYVRLLLGRAATEAKLYAVAVQAYMKILELLPLIRKDHIQQTIPKSIDPHNEEFQYPRLENRRDLCLLVVEMNQKNMGNDAISLQFAKQALDLTQDPKTASPVLSESIRDLEHVPNETVTESYLNFLIGRICYKYVLTLAGGISVASSPPVAAVPHAGDVSIKSLLEESVTFLEKAYSSAVQDLDDPNGARAIGLQLSIVRLERREEEKALQLMKEHDLDDIFLEELESERLKARNPSSEGYNTKLLTPFIHVLYSPDVYHRLLSHVRPQRILSSSMNQDGTVSSIAGPVVTRVRRTQSSPIQCTYCCMSFSSMEPFACAACADQRIFVFYCSEECLQDDYPGHQMHCVKSGRGLHSSLDEHVGDVPGSLDNVPSSNLLSGSPSIEMAKMAISSPSALGDFGHEALQFFKLTK